MTPSAMMRRQSRFKELGILGVIGFIISMIITIILAVLKFGAMSIVYGVIAKDAFQLFATGYTARWRPSITFLLIGKYFGAVILGIYNRAYAFMLLPLQKISNIVTETSLPTLKDFQRDDKRLYSAIEKIIITQYIFLIPPILFIWSERYMVINILYGSQWNDVARYLTFLLPVILFDMSRNNLLQAYIIKNETRAQFFLSLIFTSVVICAIVVGILSEDIMKLVLFYSLSKLIIWLPSCKFSSSLLNVRVRDIIKAHLDCIIAYWPLLVLVMLQSVSSYAFGISEYSPGRFVIFSLVFAVSTIMCINGFSTKKKYLFLFDSFAFLRWPQKYLGMLRI
jgi:O-antigen/teichoic acid export membrane protein